MDIDMIRRIDTASQRPTLFAEKNREEMLTFTRPHLLFPPFIDAPPVDLVMHLHTNCGTFVEGGGFFAHISCSASGCLSE